LRAVESDNGMGPAQRNRVLWPIYGA
jgi:hypothetical protein